MVSIHCLVKLGSFCHRYRFLRNRVVPFTNLPQNAAVPLIGVINMKCGEFKFLEC